MAGQCTHICMLSCTSFDFTHVYCGQSEATQAARCNQNTILMTERGYVNSLEAMGTWLSGGHVTLLHALPAPPVGSAELPPPLLQLFDAAFGSCR